MEYGKIISVTGMGGLFELVGSKKDGAIVKSLEDKSTKFVSSRIHNFSHLESIEVYTVRDNVNLVELLKAMETSGKPLPDQKDATAVKNYFLEVYPDMDFERVYASDMKKMVKWYSVLKDNEVELKLSEAEEEEEEVAETPVTEKEEKPVKAKPTADTTTAKKAEPKASEEKPAEEPSPVKAKAEAKKDKAETSEKVIADNEIEAPKKKAPRKKKTED